MSLTVTSIKRTPFEGMVMALASIAFDATYPAAGEELEASTLGLAAFHAVFVTGGSAGFLFTAVRVDDNTWKIKAYESGTADAALDEFDAGAGLEAVTDVRVLAFGV